MKTERRHELKENALAHGINELGEKVRPHSQVILAVLIAAVAIVAALVIRNATVRSKVAASWAAFYASQQEPESLVGVAQQFPSTAAAPWALLVSADIHLRQGQNAVYSDRKQAAEALGSAVEDFDAAMEMAVGNEESAKMIRTRALFGLGQAHETLYGIEGDKENLNKALTAYRQLIESQEDAALAKAAQARAEQLQSDQTKNFYRWFALQEPPTPGDPTGDPHAMKQQPSVVEPMASPFDLRGMPDAPSKSLPEVQLPKVDLPNTDLPNTALPDEPAPQADAPAKEDLKEAVKEDPKEAVKEDVKEAAKDDVKDDAKEAVKEDAAEAKKEESGEQKAPQSKPAAVEEASPAKEPAEQP